MAHAESSEFHPFRSAESRDRYLARYDEVAASWPIPFEARTVVTDYGRTFVRISGPSDGPPLVLLPGQWGNSSMWFREIEAFSERFRTYAVDPIDDFGRSVETRPVRVAADYMSWLDGLFDALGLTHDVNLLGVSYGGWMSAEYVLHAPQRLARVVWVSPAGTVARLSTGLILRGFPLFGAAYFLPSRLTIGALMRWLMADAVAAPWFGQYVEDLVLAHQCFKRRRMMVKGAGRVLANAELRDISVPVLYVVGEHERMSSPQAAVARLNAVAPQIQTRIISGEGHEAAAPVQPVLQFLGEGLTEHAHPADSAPAE